ncbi:MAG: hypothetical protein ACRCZ9_12165 [Fusobacteriaceae bacterium]
MIANFKREYFIKPLTPDILNSFMSTLAQLPETTKVAPYLQCPHVIPEFEASSGVLIGYKPAVIAKGKSIKKIRIGRKEIELEGIDYQCTVCNDKYWWLSPEELGYQDTMTEEEADRTLYENTMVSMRDISYLFGQMLHQEKLTRGIKAMAHPAIAEFTGPNFLNSLADTSVGPRCGGVKRLNGVIMMLTVDTYHKVYSNIVDILIGKNVSSNDNVDIGAVKPMIGDVSPIQNVMFESSPTAVTKPISNYGFAIGNVTPTFVNRGQASFKDGVAVGAPGVSGAAIGGGSPNVAPSKTNIAD